MKTKNKMIASMEIAIVLFSMFLVALPATGIAAEQTTQKTSAGTSAITTASEDDYVLGVYGNANEDDTIDMRDLTYVKLIFFGKKPETELADAKYDGKINPLDFIQIKLIIVGKEKELTIVDGADKIVTVSMPVERVIAAYHNAVETLRSIKATDKIVGVNKGIIDDDVFFPEFDDEGLSVGKWPGDIEKMLELRPDVVLFYASSWADKDAKKLEDVGLKVVRFDCYQSGRNYMNYAEEIEKLGYILGKKMEADEFNDFYRRYLNTISGRVDGLSEEDKPRVYFESASKKGYKTWTPGAGYFQMVVMAGGNNIFSDLPYSGEFPIDIDPEEVVKRNPEIIIKGAPGGVACGYNLDVGDTAGLEAVVEEIMNRPELQHVTAVKNKKVYTIGGMTGTRNFIRIGYFAKWFHPELFKDLDPKAIHQEYIARFQGLDYDLDKQGVFVYPEPR